MKKTYPLTILFALLANLCYSQRDSLLDSLKHELAIAKQDTSRVIILYNLCAMYRWSDPNSALYYGDQGIDLARQINFKKGEVMVLSAQSWALNTIGSFAKSLEMGFRALKITEDYHLASMSAMPLHALGRCYNSLKNYPKALSYYKKAEALYDKIVEKEGLAYTELSIGWLFLRMSKLDSATIYLNTANQMFLKLGVFEPMVNSRLGELEIKKGNLPLALTILQKNVDRCIEENEFRVRAQTYINISTAYAMLNQRDSSIIYAEKGLAAAEFISQKETVLEAASQLAGLYEPTDIKESLRYYKIASAARDSLYGVANLQAVETIVNQENERRKEIEAAKAVYKNQLKQYGLTVGLVAVIVIAFTLLRNNQRKQKAYKLLQEQKQETEIQKKNVEKTLEKLKSTQSQLIQSEKMASLGELTAGIAHEIQNPLNFVNNFSEVNEELLAEMKDELDKGNIDDAKAIANDAIENQQKILHHGKRADAIVKGMLQHSRSSSGQKELTDINLLCDEYLRLAYHGLRAKDKSFNAKFETDFDSSIPKLNVVPQDIGRVILNLINNAFYVVNEKSKQNIVGYEPTVIVSTHRSLSTGEGRGEVIIKVKDNGNGIPDLIKEKIFQPFFTTKPTGQGTGLGLSLSYDIVKAHGGEVTVNSKDGAGSEFIIKLPFLKLIE